MNYIKIKLFIITILNLLIIPVYGNEAALSKEEVLKQITFKEGQLDILTKKVTDVENSLNSILQRIHDIGEFAKDGKKQQLRKEKSWFSITEAELQNAYFEETESFLKIFNDADHKAEIQIVGSSFFKECLKKNWASILKFNLVRFLLERKKLNVLLVEWERVSKEILDLYNQIDISEVVEGW